MSGQVSLHEFYSGILKDSLPLSEPESRGRGSSKEKTFSDALQASPVVELWPSPC